MEGRRVEIQVLLETGPDSILDIWYWSNLSLVKPHKKSPLWILNIFNYLTSGSVQTHCRCNSSLTDIRGCRHSGFRHSGFSPRGLDVRGSDVRGRLFRTLGFRTFGVFENGRSGLNPERLKLNAVSLNPERPKTPNVRK